MRTERLTAADEAALDELLEQDVASNLFLIGFLDVHPVNRAHWFGAWREGALAAAALVLPGRLTVPFATDPAAAAALGRAIRGRYLPSMMVGPRAACDALWGTWAPEVEPERWYDQRLYVCDSPPPGGPVPGFRRALASEWEVIADYSGRMEEEDLGRNPADVEPDLHQRAVRDRVQAGRTWVIEREGRIVFQINIGTTTERGCQVGGTYVPPDYRGQGLAKAGMQELCRRLLRRFPMVTLHVNEANTPAVRVYEASAFRRATPFRLVTVRP